MSEPKPVYTFYLEATTFIRFPSDRQFQDFREEMADRYQNSMVRTSRDQVRADGSTIAKVNHSRNLGAEIKGRAYGFHDGESISTVFHGDRPL